jgi:excisionase family DNA binding protein
MSRKTDRPVLRSVDGRNGDARSAAATPRPSLDAAFRILLREIVHDEVRAALHDERRAVHESGTSDECLSVKEAAVFAHVNPGTIRRWVDARELHALRAGRVYRIRRSDLDAFLQDGPPRAKAGLTPQQAAEKILAGGPK